MKLNRTCSTRLDGPADPCVCCTVVLSEFLRERREFKGLLCNFHVVVAKMREILSFTM